jgi:O-antigen/teichoic acid export membrane protein
MSANRRIASNLVATVLGEGVGALLNIYVIILIARELGPENFGAFSFILAFVGLIQLVTDMGITNVLVREIAQNAERYSAIIGSVRSLAWILTGVVLLPLSLVCLVLLEDKDFGMSLLLMASAALAVMHAVIYGAVFRAFERMTFNAIFFVVHKILLLVLVFIWMTGEATILNLCLVYLLANIAQFFMFFIATWNVFGRVKLAFDYLYLKYLLIEAIPVGFSMLFRKATLHVDSILLSALSTPLALGLFSAAYRIIQIIEMLPFTLSIPLYPQLARLAGTNMRAFNDFLNKILRFYVMIALPVMGGLFIFSSQIIGIMYTDDYQSAGLLLQALSVVVFFIFPSSIMIYVYTATQKQRLFTWVSLGVFSINAILDMIFIPFFDALGAVIGTAFAEAFFVILSLYLLNKSDCIVDVVTIIVRPLFAIFLTVGIFELVPIFDGILMLIVQGVLFLILYAILLMITRAITLAEIKTVIQGLKRPKVQSVDSQLEGNG